MIQYTKIQCVYAEVEQWVETCHQTLQQRNIQIHKQPKWVLGQVKVSPLEFTESLLGVAWPAHLVKFEGKKVTSAGAAVLVS